MFVLKFCTKIVKKKLLSFYHEKIHDKNTLQTCFIQHNVSFFTEYRNKFPCIILWLLP